MGGRTKQLDFYGCVAILRSKKSVFRGDVCGRRADHLWRGLHVCGLHKRGWAAFALVNALMTVETKS